MSSNEKGKPTHANDGWGPGKQPLHEGYQPSQEGYQPSQDKASDTAKEQGGYQPTSKGDNPGNQPSVPPGKE